MRNNERGSALVEAVPVMGFLLVLAGGLLLAAYLIFTRAWIQYHSEQALYCLAEGQAGFLCRSRLEAVLNHALPLGRSEAQTQTLDKKWEVKVTWNYGRYRYQINKQLSPEQILKSKALRW